MFKKTNEQLTTPVRKKISRRSFLKLAGMSTIAATQMACGLSNLLDGSENTTVLAVEATPEQLPLCNVTVESGEGADSVLIKLLGNSEIEVPNLVVNGTTQSKNSLLHAGDVVSLPSEVHAEVPCGGNDWYGITAPQAQETLLDRSAENTEIVNFEIGTVSAVDGQMSPDNIENTVKNVCINTRGRSGYGIASADMPMQQIGCNIPTAGATVDKTGAKTCQIYTTAPEAAAAINPAETQHAVFAMQVSKAFDGSALVQFCKNFLK